MSEAYWLVTTWLRGCHPTHVYSGRIVCVGRNGQPYLPSFEYQIPDAVHGSASWCGPDEVVFANARDVDALLHARFGDAYKGRVKCER